MSLFASETRKEIKGYAKDILDLFIRRKCTAHMEYCVNHLCEERSETNGRYLMMALGYVLQEPHPDSQIMMSSINQIHRDLGFPPIPPLTIDELEEDLESLKHGNWIEQSVHAHIKTLVLNADWTHFTPPPPL
jgi:hypothetical protein